MPATLRQSLTPIAAALLGGMLLLTWLFRAAAVPAPDESAGLDSGVVKIEGPEGPGHRVGSGFIVRIDGELAYILTAAHVVRGNRETRVRFSSRRHLAGVPAQLISPQHQDDLGLALLSVPAAEVRQAGARALPLSSGALPGRGLDVVLLGHPCTVGDWATLGGRVATREGELLKVQASGVNEGSSGGPVLRAAQVIGVVMTEANGIATIKSAVNIRNYLEGVIPEAMSAPAKLTVRSNVTDDSVFIDGERLGATRLDLNLPPGTHRIRVEKDGYEPFETQVTLRSGESQTVRAEIKKGVLRSSESQTVRAEIKKPVPESGRIFRDCDQCPELVVIPAGSMRMGSPETEQVRNGDEGRWFTEPFALGRREVSVGEFRAFVESAGYPTEAERGLGCATWDGAKWQYDPGRNWRSPGFAQGDDHPVVCVSWNDAQAYVDWLAKRTGKLYRLPSEAEWEYAARAGASTARLWGESADQACAYANVTEQLRTRALREARTWDDSPEPDCVDVFRYTAPIGSFKPNAFGLDDMLGNVWEWTTDCWNLSYWDLSYQNTQPVLAGAEPPGRKCKKYVVRGWSWDVDPQVSVNRFGLDAVDRYYGGGFRPARTL
jgi:formylglycine-generating enzyme required for sulfatase activity